MLHERAACARPTGRRLTVFAAASLHEAFDAAGAAFAKQTGIAVTFSFGGSDTLVTQLAQGAPADVFASANEAQSVARATRDCWPSRRARSRAITVVLIVPKDNPAKVVGLADIAKPGVKVVLAAPTVPVGGYARTAFRKLNGAPGYPARLRRGPSNATSSPTSST